MIESIIVLLIVGVVVGFITTYIPMPKPFKAAILIVGALFCLIYLTQLFGLTHFHLHNLAK